MQGLLFFACSNMSRTRDAPTPTNISTKSEPEIVKNGTLASPAIARAINVLPVPGGPTINTPRGILPPSRWNLPGSRRNSTSSPTSSLASSQPATSANVVVIWSSFSSRALLLPKDIAPRPPPPCICRMKNIHTPINSNIGNHEINICASRLGSSTSVPFTLTLLSSSVFSSVSPPSGITERKRSPVTVVPVTSRLIGLISTSRTLPRLMSSISVEYSIERVALWFGVKLLNTEISTSAMTSHNNIFLTKSFKKHLCSGLLLIQLTVFNAMIIININYTYDK